MHASDFRQSHERFLSEQKLARAMARIVIRDQDLFCIQGIDDSGDGNVMAIVTQTVGTPYKVSRDNLTTF